MILIDTSAWIEYYRKNGNEYYKKKIIPALKENLAAICGIITTELLVHTRTKKEYQLLESDFFGIIWLETDKRVYNKASEIGFDLKRRGITIPATDLIIASCALIYNSSLLHYDKHYEKIKEFFPLETITFLTTEG
jgi:predicted nucleic acid-binding protein